MYSGLCNCFVKTRGRVSCIIARFRVLNLWIFIAVVVFVNSMLQSQEREILLWSILSYEFRKQCTSYLSINTRDTNGAFFPNKWVSSVYINGRLDKLRQQLFRKWLLDLNPDGQLFRKWFGNLEQPWMFTHMLSLRGMVGADHGSGSTSRLFPPPCLSHPPPIASQSSPMDVSPPLTCPPCMSLDLSPLLPQRTPHKCHPGAWQRR